ncbi:response regulator [uncultured Bradyrhizobium sp.]|uniref:response regulator n=1 Tax=uncultured Bradyrhizobium sp. TaxID=199684 RepID=UPI003457BF30
MTAFRVLHIDDDQDIRRIVQLSLGTQVDFNIRSCASGREAIAVATEWAPQLIICDVMMPEMDGPTTLARLRERPTTCSTPFVFMTARAQPHELEQFSALGASGVITKPFSAKELCDSVRRLLEADRASTHPADVSLDIEPDEVDQFRARLRRDAVTLAVLNKALLDMPGSTHVLLELGQTAHRLAGAAACYGFSDVSERALALERAVLGRKFMDKASDLASEIEAVLDSIAGHAPSLQ